MEGEPRDALTEKIIGCGMAVHRVLGPGLLELAYEECLCYELEANEIAFERQVPLPVVYRGVEIDCAYRLDIVVENKVVLELKAVDALLPIHEAQLLTYLKLFRLQNRPAHQFSRCRPAQRHQTPRIITHQKTCRRLRGCSTELFLWH